MKCVSVHIEVGGFMKLSLLLPGLIVATCASLIVACGKQSNSSNDIVSCPAGNVNTPDGKGCVPVTITPTGIPAGTKIGFFAQSANFPYYNANGSQMNFGSGMRTLLKSAMSVCDRENLSGGLADCGSWLGGYHDIIMQFDGSVANQAKLMIRSAPQTNAYWNYAYSLPNFEQFMLGLFGFYTGNMTAVNNPMKLTTTLWPINANQGFELRATGPSSSYAWWRLLQLQVMNGKIEDPSVQFKLFIDGGNQQMEEVMSGTMVRCQTLNCGVQGL